MFSLDIFISVSNLPLSSLFLFNYSLSYYLILIKVWFYYFWNYKRVFIYSIWFVFLSLFSFDSFCRFSLVSLKLFIYSDSLSLLLFNSFIFSAYYSTVLLYSIYILPDFFSPTKTYYFNSDLSYSNFSIFFSNYLIDSLNFYDSLCYCSSFSVKLLIFYSNLFLCYYHFCFSFSLSYSLVITDFFKLLAYSEN